MAEEDSRVCADCGRHYLPGESLPCPGCGGRTIALPLTAQPVTSHASIAGRQTRSPGVRDAVVRFVEKTKVSRLGRLARESLRFDRSDPAKTTKTHRVEEQQSDGSWTVVHDEHEEFPAKRRRRR